MTPASVAGIVAIRLPRLPDHALDAAAAFHADHLPAIRRRMAEGEGPFALVLAPAPYDHADWRQAAVRDLARAAPDTRINLVAGDDEAAIAATLTFLAASPGITGQYLPTDGQGAGVAVEGRE